jgi:predicted RNA-binding Zn-ribbon protein involved in translation (DUF1610 family)
MPRFEGGIWIMDLKKIIWVVGLVVVAILAFAWSVRSHSRSTVMPESVKKEVAGIEVEKIDRKTFEVMKMTAGEWDKLGQKDGNWKNPKTGAYTMATPMICNSCGETIPGPEISPNMDVGSRLATASKYLCPKCGKKAGRH